MKKTLFFLLVGIHFAVILYSNIVIEEQAISYQYTRKKVKGKAMTLLNKNETIAKAFDIYGTYTGTSTGYGFYAPSVANQLIFMFTLKDKHQQAISVQQIPFKNKDGYIRYMNIGCRYLERPDKGDSIENRLLDAVIKSMALWMIDTHPGTHSIEVDLLLYNIAPSFAEIGNPDKNKYIKMEHYEYSL